MSDDVLIAMRALREDMRRRLLQSPEYRALEALDSAIDEIAGILQEKRAHAAQEPEAPVAPPPPASEIQIAAAPAAVQPGAPGAEAPPSSAARHTAIAAAFAETLAAKLDPRNPARQAAAHQPARRAHFE